MWHVCFFFGLGSRNKAPTDDTYDNEEDNFAEVFFFARDFFLVLEFFFERNKAPTDDAYYNEEDNFAVDFIV